MNSLFFELIRVSIGTQDSLSRVPTEREWDKLYKMSIKHSLAGVCYEGLQNLGADADSVSTAIGMNEMLYMNWVGMAATIQQKYEQHAGFIAKLSRFYESEGVGMMLLKGYGLSLNYPVPEMRSPGDVDIYLFDSDVHNVPAWKLGDDAVSRAFNVKVRDDSEHHTQFVLDGISVENHYDFINTRLRKSSQSLEKLFKELAEDHGNSIDVNGQRVYLPSDKLNSLFLLRHSSGHFAAEGITMRNVLDWGFFVCGAKGLDWDWLWKMAEKFNMHRFLMCLNAICVEDLGMDGSHFELRYYDKALKERVLEEILMGTDLVSDASVWLRTKRWWQHRWKHRICYSDSLLSSFVYSVKANLESK